METKFTKPPSPITRSPFAVAILDCGIKHVQLFDFISKIIYAHLNKEPKTDSHTILVKGINSNSCCSLAPTSYLKKHVCLPLGIRQLHLLYYRKYKISSFFPLMQIHLCFLTPYGVGLNT